MPHVYILSNRFNNAIYVGVTSNIENRMNQHQSGISKSSHTKKYNIDKLVYVEEFSSMTDAIQREKQIKKMRRAKKDLLITSINPIWKELH